MTKLTKGGTKHKLSGCFSRDGMGPLVRIDGIMDATKYKGILQRQMLPHAREYMAPNWIFQHDNDPKHTSGLVKRYLERQQVRVLPWPAQSPDLNPIEHVWGELEKRVRTKNYRNGDELFAALQREWDRFDIETCIKLVDSMGNRCAAVKASKGFPTKY